MFFSDRLYEIGSSVKLFDEEDEIRVIKDMLNACFEESKKQQDFLKSKPKDIKADIAIFDRINLTFELTVDKLNKEGKDFVKIDGYKLFIQKGYPELYEFIFGNKREELNRELKK